MKRFALCVIVVIVWQQAVGQQKTEEEKKLELFNRVDKVQDSSLKMLNKPVEKKINSRPAKKKIDTLTVKGNTIISPIDTLYEDLYFVKPDTTSIVKKKS